MAASLRHRIAALTVEASKALELAKDMQALVTRVCISGLSFESQGMD